MFLDAEPRLLQMAGAYINAVRLRRRDLDEDHLRAVKYAFVVAIEI